jgi:hypothetical protein
MGHHDDAGSTGTNKSCVGWQRNVRREPASGRGQSYTAAATLLLCTRLAVFWHRHHVGAYIFDCAKHAAVFDRQRLSDLVRRYAGDSGKTGRVEVNAISFA